MPNINPENSKEIFQDLAKKLMYASICKNGLDLNEFNESLSYLVKNELDFSYARLLRKQASTVEKIASAMLLSPDSEDTKVFQIARKVNQIIFDVQETLLVELFFQNPTEFENNIKKVTDLSLLEKVSDLCALRDPVYSLKHLKLLKLKNQDILLNIIERAIILDIDYVCAHFDQFKLQSIAHRKKCALKCAKKAQGITFLNHLKNFELDPELEQDYLVELALICVKNGTLGIYTSYIKEFKISPKNQNILIEIAMELSLQKNASLAEYINYFQIDSSKYQKKLVQMAKNCAKYSPTDLALYIENFKLDSQNQEALLEIARLCVNYGGVNEFLSNFDHFQIDTLKNQEPLLEVLSLVFEHSCIVNHLSTIEKIGFNFKKFPKQAISFASLITSYGFVSFKDLARIFQLEYFRDEDAFLQIYFSSDFKDIKLQDYGIDPAKEAKKIVQVIARLVDRGVKFDKVSFFRHFPISSEKFPVVYLKLATLFLEKEGLEELSINFLINAQKHLNKKDITSLLRKMALKNGSLTSTHLSSFELDSDFEIIEILNLCAKSADANELIYNLEACGINWEQYPKEAYELALLCSQISGEETSLNIHVFFLENPKQRLKVAQACVKNSPEGGVLENFNYFELDPDEFEKEILAMGLQMLLTEEADVLFSNIDKLGFYPSNHRESLIKLSQKAAETKQLIFPEDLGIEFENEKEALEFRKKLVRSHAQRNGHIVAAHFKFYNFKNQFTDEEKVELVKICARSNAQATIEFFDHFEIDYSKNRKEIFLFILNLIELAPYDVFLFIKKIKIDPLNYSDDLFEIGFRLASKIDFSLTSFLEKSQLNPLKNPFKMRQLIALGIMNERNISAYYKHLPINELLKLWKMTSEEFTHWTHALKFLGNPLSSDLAHIYLDARFYKFLEEKSKIYGPLSHFLNKFLEEKVTQSWDYDLRRTRAAAMAFVVLSCAPKTLSENILLAYEEVISYRNIEVLKNFVLILSGENQSLLESLKPHVKNNKRLSVPMLPLAKWASNDRNRALLKQLCEQMTREKATFKDKVDSLTQVWTSTCLALDKCLTLSDEQKLSILIKLTEDLEKKTGKEAKKKNSKNKEKLDLRLGFLKCFLQDPYFDPQKILPILKLDAKDINSLFQSLFSKSLAKQKSINFEAISDFTRKYQQVFFESRVPMAWKIYLNQLDKLSDPKVIELYNECMRQIIESSFQKDRYEGVFSLQSKHQQKICEKHSHVWEKWKVSSKERDNLDVNSERYEVFCSDDWQDIFLCGFESTRSCQSFDADITTSIGLLAYMLEGKIKILVVKDPTTKRVVGRSIFRILWDEKKQVPALFVEKTYADTNTSEFEYALREYAKKEAKRLSLNLYVSNSVNSINTALSSYEGITPQEYVDAVGGLCERGVYKIGNLELLV